MGKALEWLGGSVLVYAVVAACSGGADRSEPIALDVDSGAGTGGMMGSGGTGPERDSGLGDVVADALDAMVNPVPDADAQTPPNTTYEAQAVNCGGTIRMSGSDWPAAILNISPPSMVRALSVKSVAPNAAVEGGWLQASGGGGFVKPDGSQLGLICASEEDVITFYVPS